MTIHLAFIAWSLGHIPVPGNGGFNVKSVANGAMQSALDCQKRQNMLFAMFASKLMNNIDCMPSYPKGLGEMDFEDFFYM